MNAQASLCICPGFPEPLLIWVQSVCKSYQQTTLVDKELRHHLQIISFQLQGGGDMSLLKNFDTQAVRQGFVIDDVSSLLKSK